MKGFLENLMQIKEKNKREMDDYVREQNEKYNKLLHVKLDLEDALKSEKQLTESLKKQLEQMKADYERKIAGLLGENQGK